MVFILMFLLINSGVYMKKLYMGRKDMGIFIFCLMGFLFGGRIWI